MIGEPPRSEYDIRFKLFGLPVRVHPWFWIIFAIFGMQSEIGDMRIWLTGMLCWIAAAFVSILVHELGHALLLSKVFGARTWIVLYGMGGLACHDHHYYKRIPGTTGEIAISAAGPFIGFALVAVLAALLSVCGFPVVCSIHYFADVIPFPSVYADLGGLEKVLPPIVCIALSSFVHYVFFFSLFWGILNLLPIYPLDGGQISREIFLVFDRRTGIVNSLWLSVIVGCALAVLDLSQWVTVYNMEGFPIIAILFGYLAYQSYQMLGMYSRY